jgi:hypothetical protein
MKLTVLPQVLPHRLTLALVGVLVTAFVPQSHPSKQSTGLPTTVAGSRGSPSNLEDHSVEQPTQHVQEQ